MCAINSPSPLPGRVSAESHNEAAAFGGISCPVYSGRRHAHASRHIAVGHASGHHGEILQGVFRDDMGAKHRGLVTLLCPYFESIAWGELTTEQVVTIDPPDRVKAARAAELLLKELGRSDLGLRLRIRSNIPAGYGLGSSTADILAALRSVAVALGQRLTPEHLLSLAVKAETASDATMFTEEAVLIAHRDGVLLDRFEKPLPDFTLVSVNVAPDNPVETLQFAPARYTDAEIETFGVLWRDLRIAVEAGDLSLLGKVATVSARINQRHLPQPNFGLIVEIAEQGQACGIQVAHSGRMIGIMMPPRLHRKGRAVRTVMGQLRELGMQPAFYPSMH